MVTRPMTRRRKLAQTRGQSVYPSSRKRWRGDGTFSSKMVISSDMPAAFTHHRAKKIIEASRVSPKLDHYNFSGYADVDQQEDNAEGSIRQTLTTGLEVTGEVSSSDKPLASDTILEIHNQVGEWYAGAVEPSSSGSETAQPSAQTSADVLQRLDPSSETWKVCSVDDKARRCLTSSSGDIDSSHRQFEHIQEISCKYPAVEKPRKSELLRLIDEGLLVDINANTSRDPFDGKYWNDGLNVDLHGSDQYSQNPELNQQRREFPEEQFRYDRGSRLPRHSQVSDPVLVEVPCSPRLSTCTHLNSWQPDRESITSHPTSQRTITVKNMRLASTPSDCTLNLSDASAKSFLAICLIAAPDDEACSSATIRHHAKTFSAQELLEPWKNVQDHDHSPPASPRGLFKDFPESRDHLFGLPISSEPNEIIFTALAQPFTHRANPEDELYNCNWETTPAASLDCPGTAFNSTDNWKLVDDPEEHPEFPPLPDWNFGVLDYEEEDQPQSFHSEPSDPFAFTSFERPAGRLSSPEFSDCGLFSETTADHRIYFNSADARCNHMDNCLS